MAQNMKIYYLTTANKHYDISQEIFTQHETPENWEAAASRHYGLH
jgi:hypothetical protein